MQWKRKGFKMSGGVYPGCHPGQAPGHSGGGHDAGPGDLDPGTSLEQGEWNPLLCFLCHQVRLSCEEHNQWSLLSDLPWALPPSLLPHFLCELPQGPESGWQTVMSNLWVSEARSHNVPAASVWPQSNCYRKVTSLRDGHSVPPTDSLLRFLVESSSDEFPSCANCDRNEKSPMFFCNTCGKWWSWMGGGSGNKNFSPSLLAAI